MVIALVISIVVGVIGLGVVYRQARLLRGLRRDYNFLVTHPAVRPLPSAVVRESPPVHGLWVMTDPDDRSKGWEWTGTLGPDERPPRPVFVPDWEPLAWVDQRRVRPWPFKGTTGVILNTSRGDHDAGRHPVTVGVDPPSDPEVGDTWVDMRRAVDLHRGGLHGGDYVETRPESVEEYWSRVPLGPGPKPEASEPEQVWDPLSGWSDPKTSL